MGNNLKSYKKKEHIMVFCEDIAKLSSIANNLTMFYAHLLTYMDKGQEINLNRSIKKKIIHAIGSTSEKPLHLANQYLSELGKADLITSLGDDAYMVNPTISSRTSFKEAVDKKTIKYMEVRRNKKGAREINVVFDDE